MGRSHDCYHCGERLPDGQMIVASINNIEHPMCCLGCKAVAEFIAASGFDAFYKHRDRPSDDLNLTPEETDWTKYDLEDLQVRYVHSEGKYSEATIDIGGMYCSACVWLLDTALSRVGGLQSIDVNPVTRRAVISWDSDNLLFSDVLTSIAQIGFKPSPVAAGVATDPQDAEYRVALKRLIVAAAAGMQAMMFAVALYAGDYFGIDRDIEKFLRTISLLVTLPIVFYSARPFFASAWRGLIARSPGMDLPVSIAIGAAFIASTWATWSDRGEIYFDSVAMFVFFLSASRFLEMRAKHRTDDQALALRSLLPDTVEQVVNGVSRTIGIDQLRVGDSVNVKLGDVMPADGEIRLGALLVDESMLTGESQPIRRASGAKVFAGGLVRQGNATVTITNAGASTSLAEIGRMLERAKADRPPIALLADRVASYFVVAVLVLTTIAGTAWTTIDPSRAFEVALATLVVTCPCALAIATPAAIAAATTRLSRSGFLLVRARILEVINRARVIVFDKTGTLTEGQPVILETQRLSDNAPENRTLLAIMAEIENASEHVLARAFLPWHIPGRYEISDINLVPGAGVEACIDGIVYRIGHAGFVAGSGDVEFDLPEDNVATFVFLGREHEVLARFDIGDKLRHDARESIRALQSAGYHTVIASGDRESAVASIANQLGIDEFYARMTPAEKLALVRRFRGEGETVVMVGDGVNDAPVLAAADASIALDAGTALARASADAVSLGRNLDVIVTATRIARETRQIIKQNLAWAVTYNVIAVPLAVTGMLAPWMAAIGMSLSSLMVVLNSLRLHRVSVGDSNIAIGENLPMTEPKTA